MEDIKENECVRTKMGEIGRVIAIKENPGRVVIDDCGQIVLIADITKHSFNLIDLLEYGDYVNLERILDITEEYIRTTETIHNKSWLAKNITSILTHEQFEANCYKVTIK